MSLFVSRHELKFNSRSVKLQSVTKLHSNIFQNVNPLLLLLFLLTHILIGAEHVYILRLNIISLFSRFLSMSYFY